MEKNKILVVAAHPDDEILGAGGTLIRHINQGDVIHFLILSDGETSRTNVSNVQKRRSQAEKVAKSIGAASVALEEFPDNSFDTVPLLSLAKTVEKYVSKLQPVIIYTHHLFDLNVDHRLTAQAVLTACRPQPGVSVKEIYSFEVPSSTEWQAKLPSHVFMPTVYVDITNTIDRKIELLSIYSNELQTYPHPRSKEGIKLLAQYRGLEVGRRFCEAFALLRKIVP